jgi:hypothetical protein
MTGQKGHEPVNEYDISPLLNMSGIPEINLALLPAAEEHEDGTMFHSPVQVIPAASLETSMTMSCDPAGGVGTVLGPVPPAMVVGGVPDGSDESRLLETIGTIILSTCRGRRMRRVPRGHLCGRYVRVRRSRRAAAASSASWVIRRIANFKGLSTRRYDFQDHIQQVCPGTDDGLNGS